MSPSSRDSGSVPRRNRLLRPLILAALHERGQLDATELARLVYERPGRWRRLPLPDRWKIAATRRALRHLVAKGKVAPAGKFRRRNTFCLTADVEFWLALSLGAFDD